MLGRHANQRGSDDTITVEIAISRMTVPVLRPTFLLQTSLSPVQARNRVLDSVKEKSSDLSGQFTEDHALVSFVGTKSHFWSPWLHLEFRESDLGVQIFGRFSPHPSIWTAFIFAYFSLAAITFFSIIAGVAQTVASESPWGFLMIPLCGFVALALWLVSQTGQKFAQNEMQELKQLVVSSIASESPKNRMDENHE